MSRAGWPHEDTIHAWWVEPGLLAGAYPGAIDPTAARRKVELLVEVGVRTFIDLTEPGELESYDAFVEVAAAFGDVDVRRVNVPIVDAGTSDDSTYDHIVELIREGQRRGVVYLHCGGGVGRTGTVVGWLLARGGLGYDEVIDRIGRLRAGSTKSGRRCPETDGQHDALRRIAGG